MISELPTIVESNVGIVLNQEAPVMQICRVGNLVFVLTFQPVKHELVCSPFFVGKTFCKP